MIVSYPLTLNEVEPVRTFLARHGFSELKEPLAFYNRHYQRGDGNRCLEVDLDVSDGGVVSPHICIVGQEEEIGRLEEGIFSMLIKREPNFRSTNN